MTENNKSLQVFIPATPKGGVGKSITTINLAEACARRGKKVLVIDAVYNTAAEGAAESNSFIGGLSAALFYRPKNAGLMTPSAGYVFNWTGLIGTTGGAGVRIKTFRMEHLASDRVEIDSAFDMRLVSADLGFYFNNVISAV